MSLESREHIHDADFTAGVTFRGHHSVSMTTLHIQDAVSRNCVRLKETTKHTEEELVVSEPTRAEGTQAGSRKES